MRPLLNINIYAISFIISLFFISCGVTDNKSEEDIDLSNTAWEIKSDTLVVWTGNEMFTKYGNDIEETRDGEFYEVEIITVPNNNYPGTFKIIFTEEFNDEEYHMKNAYDSLSSNERSEYG